MLTKQSMLNQFFFGERKKKRINHLTVHKNENINTKEIYVSLLKLLIKNIPKSFKFNYLICMIWEFI